MNEDPLFEHVNETKSLYKGKYLHLERLHLRLPDGKEGTREVVRVRDAVAILPVDTDGTVYLIRQHRPAIGKTIIEAPAGIMDKKNESLEECARRECEEETGIVPGKLTKLITYAHAEGYSTGFITLFLGTSLEKGGKLNLDQSEFVEQVSMPYKQLLGMVKENRIIDSKTILCALLSENLLKG
jgi:ADP-ribose pyrophosphatase